MVKFDPRKPCTTRDGKPARVCSTILAGRRKILAVITEDNGEECPYSFYADGTYVKDCTRSSSDLINPPVEKELWVNIFIQGGDAMLHSFPSQAEADSYNAKLAPIFRRAACKHIKYKVGDRE